MSIKIGAGFGAFFSMSSSRDDEWKRIIDRLWYKYGIRSTGSKSADKNKLHELELQEAKQEAEPSSSKFLTLSKKELDNIKEKNKNKTKNKNKQPLSTTGAEILGSQLFLATQINNATVTDNAKRKRNNKYYSS